MLDKIEETKKELTEYIVSSVEELEVFRLKYLSKKGLITQLFNEFKTLTPDQKKNAGHKINELKQKVNVYHLFIKKL